MMSIILFMKSWFLFQWSHSLPTGSMSPTASFVAIVKTGVLWGLMMGVRMILSAS